MDKETPVTDTVESGTAEPVQEAPVAAEPAAETPPAATEEGGTEAEATETPAAGQETEPGKEHTPVGVQKKIDKEVGRRKRAEEEAAYYRGLYEGARTGMQPQTPASGQQQELTPPDPRAYATNAEYLDALTDYKVEIKIREKEAKAQIEARQREEQSFQQSRQSVVETIITKGIEEFDDFEDVTSTRNLTLDSIMVDTLITMGDGAHRVEYYLGKNKDEARRILSMKSPAEKVLALQEVRNKLATAAKKPTTTTTPPPVKPITGGAQPAKDPNRMTEAEWFKWREQQKQERRRGRV